MTYKIRFSLLLVCLVLVLGVGQSSKLTEDEIVDLVNQDRIRHGLSTLTLNPILTTAAKAKATDMISNQYFSHTSPTGTNPWHWLKLTGYKYAYAGENLAQGYTEADELENSWMSSPTHRANILSPFYSDIGIAIVAENNKNLIVEFFASPQSKVTLRQ